MRILVIAIAITCLGCATIPKESAELSAELGYQIASAERAHIALIGQYEKARRDRAEDFLRYVWTPRFIKNFLATPEVSKALKSEVCGSKAGEMDRALVVQDVVEAISKKVEAKRLELMSAIDAATSELYGSLSNHYGQARRMNGAITANLRAAVEGLEYERAIRAALTKPVEDVVPIKKASEKLDRMLDWIEE